MAARRRERQLLGRLCGLAADSLLPHIEATRAPPSDTPPTFLTQLQSAALQEPSGPPQRLAPADERRLLLALSRVKKAIRGWDEGDQGCQSNQEVVSCSGEVHSCCLPPERGLYDGSGCLVNIVSILVAFLGLWSDYVNHSARKLLVAISSTLIKFESVWIQFVELLWVVIHAASTSSYDALSSKPDINDCAITASSTNIIAILRMRHISIDGQVMANLFQVLHGILKFLKQSDSELKDGFICLSLLYIQRISWDSVHQINAGESHGEGSRFSFYYRSGHSGILTGSLLQLLCSLLEQRYLEGTDGQDVSVKLLDIGSKLAVLLQGQHCGPTGLYEYLRHKILMIIIRLKSYVLQDCSHIVCWLKLLRQYFQDLLHQPISQHIDKSDNCLEESPFLLDMVGSIESEDRSNRHLQRQAIYLFISCSMCLTYKRNNDILHCSCKRDDCLSSHKVQGCSNHCTCFGLSEMSEWFQRFYSVDIGFESKSSPDFALSFLQLYMEEDDMLFSILIQLLDAPLIFSEIDSMETSELIGAKLFSSIFDPVHIFHLLLFLLHYDHLVLVDYLISKDAGVHCAQYLLRCLRIVNKSWHAFVDDSVYNGKIEKLNCKKQRISKDINARGSSSKEHTIVSNYDKEPCRLFFNSQVCLLSLKRTVEDLQKKGLFPYNPKPLLRSLAKFEELCEQE